MSRHKSSCCSSYSSAFVPLSPLTDGTMSSYFSHMSVHYVEVEVEERDSVVEEALDMRRRRQALSRCEVKADLVLVQPIRCLS